VSAVPWLSPVISDVPSLMLIEELVEPPDDVACPTVWAVPSVTA
jgi:hypothetical protein